MNSTRTCGVCFAALMLAAMNTTARAIVIDDFTSDTLSPAYAQSIVFTQGSSATVTYDTTTTTDRLTYSFTGASSAALQTTLLRDDYVLATNGDSVQITARIPSLPSGGAPTNLFGGLVLHPTTKTIPTPGVSSDTSRAALVSIDIDGDGRVIVQTGASQPFVSSSGTISIGSDVVLRLTRISATTVLPEYSTNGGVTFSPAGGLQTVLGFNALGVYDGNARSSAVGTVVFDDLIFTPFVATVPEPSTWLLAAAGVLGLAGFTRSNRR